MNNKIENKSYGTHKDVIWLLLNNLSFIILGIPSNLFVSRVIGPAGYGLLKFFQTIITYTSMSDFGMAKALHREIPLNPSASEIVKSVNVVFSYTIASSLFSIFIVYLFFLFDIFLFDNFDNYIFILLVCTILSQRFVIFIGKTILGGGHYIINSKLHITFNIIRPILTIVLAKYLELKGVLIAYFICDVLYFLILQSYVKIKPKIDFDGHLIKKLFKIGISIFSSGFGGKLFWNFEVILVPIFFSLEDTGIYAYALSFILISRQVSDSFNNYIFRNMALLFNRNDFNENETYFNKTKNYISITNLFGIIITGNGYLFFENLINNFLPKFSDSVNLIYLLCNGLMFYSLKQMPSNYFSILKKFKTLIFLQLSLAIINICLFFIFVTNNDLNTVAFCRLFVFILYGLSFYYIYLRRAYSSSIKILNDMVKRIITISICMIALYFSKSIEFSTFINAEFFISSFLYEFFIMILSMLNFSIISILCYSFIYKNEKFLQKLLSIFKSIKSFIITNKVK